MIVSTAFPSSFSFVKTGLVSVLVLALTGPAYSGEMPPQTTTVETTTLVENGVVTLTNGVKRDIEDVPAYFASLHVSDKDGTTRSVQYDAIEPVGFIWGVFLANVEPINGYLPVVKLGDYNGVLHLIPSEGDIITIPGGAYALSKDQKFLFSLHMMDGSAMEIFDFQKQESWHVDVDDRIAENVYKIQNTYYVSTVPAGRSDTVVYFALDLNAREAKRQDTTPNGIADAQVEWAFDPTRDLVRSNVAGIYCHKRDIDTHE